MEKQNCASCPTQHISLFCDLPTEAIQILDSYKATNRYKKGQYLFYAGNNPTGLYCIKKGTVRLEIDGVLGKGHILRVIKAGGVLGYRSFFAADTYAASAIAHEDVEACLISKEGINELLEKYPIVALRFLNRMAKELRASEERFCHMTDKTAPERVAESLLYLKDQFSDQRWTRKEIADWAGTTPETVIRTLGDFEKKGLIAQKGRRIDIVKKGELAEEANLFD